MAFVAFFSEIHQASFCKRKLHLLKTLPMPFDAFYVSCFLKNIKRQHEFHQSIPYRIKNPIGKAERRENIRRTFTS